MSQSTSPQRDKRSKIDSRSGNDTTTSGARGGDSSPGQQHQGINRGAGSSRHQRNG